MVNGWHVVGSVAVVAFWALKTVSPVDGRVGWTVVDDDYAVHREAASFLYGLRFAADRAEGTCRTYARNLSLFFTWVAQTDRDWRRLGADDLASFVLWLERTSSRRGRFGRQRAAPAAVLVGGSVRAPSTVNGITTAVREMYRWLAVHGDVDADVAERLAAWRLRKKLAQQRPKTLTVEQAEALVAVCTNARDRFLLLVMWRCGLRREDVHFLPTSEHVGCSLQGAHLHVIRRDDNENGAWAKSRSPRDVPAPREVLDGYAAYRAERAEVAAAAASDFVFVNLWGGTVGRALTAGAVEDLFVRLSAAAGMRARPHMLRHSFGTALAAAGVGVDVIQRLLGHAQITSTQLYLHPDWEQMRRAVDRIAEGSVLRSGVS